MIYDYLLLPSLTCFCFLFFPSPIQVEMTDVMVPYVPEPSRLAMAGGTQEVQAQTGSAMKTGISRSVFFWYAA